MSRLSAIAVVVVVLGLLPPAARAQQVDVRAISFGIGGGVSVPFDKAREAYKTGFNGSVFLRLDLGAVPWSVRADFSYQNFELQPAVIPPSGLPGGGTGTLLAGLGSAQVYLHRGKVRPYLLAGIGACSVRTEFDAPALATRTETRPMARAGIGVLLSFGSLQLYAEGGLDHIAPRTGAPVGEAIRAVPLTVGVIF